MDILVIIQARVGSSRLPNKVLLPLGTKTVIEQVVNRVKKSKLIDELVVATSIEKNNLPLIHLCSGAGIRIFAGEENDVLDRFYQAAKLIKPKHIVRITADCPLHDPEIIDKVIKEHCDARNDYTSNTDPPTYPDGLDVEIFTYEALIKTWNEAELISQREHVTPYMRTGNIFSRSNVKNEIDYSSLRWTLDEEVDYTLIKEIYDYFNNKEIFYFKDILQLIEKNPYLRTINSTIQRNEGYEKSLKKDKRIVKK